MHAKNPMSLTQAGSQLLRMFPGATALAAHIGSLMKVGGGLGAEEDLYGIHLAGSKKAGHWYLSCARGLLRGCCSCWPSDVSPAKNALGLL